MWILSFIPFPPKLLLWPSAQTKSINFQPFVEVFSEDSFHEMTNSVKVLNRSQTKLESLTFLTQWTLCLLLPLRTPPLDVRLLGPSVKLGHPALWFPQHSALLVLSLLPPAHTTSLFQLACLMQEIPHPKIQTAVWITTLQVVSEPASPLPAPPPSPPPSPPSISQDCPRAWGPPHPHHPSGDVIRGAQPAADADAVLQVQIDSRGRRLMCSWCSPSRLQILTLSTGGQGMVKSPGKSQDPRVVFRSDFFPPPCGDSPFLSLPCAAASRRCNLERLQQRLFPPLSHCLAWLPGEPTPLSLSSTPPLCVPLPFLGTSVSALSHCNAASSL